jgi:4-amino-4-deoxy-L-arabinose transferase-like glycosyltransferase
VLASSLLWIVFSTSVMFDVMLAVWVLLGMHGILSAAEGRRRGFVVLGLAIGLGVLTKGPVILLDLLPAAVLAPWWQGSRRDPANARAQRYWHRWAVGLVAAVGVGAALALAWAIPAGLAGGEAYRDAIFWGQTANRVVESFAHRRPFWWYVPLLPVLLFPWFVWSGFWKALIRQRREGLDRGVRFCLAWMLPVFVAFSFISGKQPHYLIPLFPAFALLLARVVSARSKSGVGLPALIVAALGAALVAASDGRFPGLQDQVAALPPAWPGVAMIVLAVGVWAAARRGSAVVSLALLGGGTLALVQLAALPALAPLYDIRPMAVAVRQVQEEGRTVANLATYHAQYQFLGRLQAPLVELRGAEIRSWLETHPDDYAIMYLKSVGDLETVEVRHGQAYRGGAAALVDARTAIRLLAEHVE